MDARLRFGVWALVHGSRGAYGDPEEPYDASWERNRALVLEAEELGYDLTLFAQHTVNPRDDALDELEPWTAAAALAALTHRIELVAAIKPLLYHPVVLAKLALQIEHISRGRFALNVVNAWNKAEFDGAGIAFPPHDQRYAYGREWLGIVEALLRGERVNHEGPHFQVRDYMLRPAGTHRPRPRIYTGGESDPARSLAAEHGDVWFINGRPLDEVELLLADLRRRPRGGRPPLRYALSAFVIARASAAEAHEHYEHLLHLADEDAKRPRARPRNVDPEVVMHQVHQHRRTIGTNGGSAADLIGSYDEVATRIRAFGRAGIDTFLLMFQPFEADMRGFAKHVLPGLR
ncbi:MAG TPA: LLM class flavin-dependent oxidoreductase [Polyangiaceae bacterium]|nr:LLM class flavin-dependent oxidoreductase [Polyangiaceae bacterium]